MAWSGLGLLVLVALGIVLTGLPAVIVLIAVSAFGAVLAVLTGTVPLALLSALPGRLVNLLESDLLQALPLYVMMGLLLDRLPVADALYRAGLAVLPRGPAAPLVSGMGLGALLGPMNGSVGASVLGLSRVVAPRLAANGVPPPMQLATIAVASTLGVVIPPSLVLILLGDAMLSAHTIAVTTTGRTDRVINTQDVFHGALVPAGILLVLCLLLSWHVGRRIPAERSPPLRNEIDRRQAMLAAVSIVSLVVLLGGVATGYFYAVEAAAMGAFVLLAAGLLTGRLRGAVLRGVLADAAATTGALFGLLIAATTFTLVLRFLGTDRLVADWVTAIPGSDVVVVAVVLLSIGLCAFVLDAFEIIFVIVPIVIPPLLIRVADARWVAVLVLLTLQTSFLLPPLGYALMMVRGTLRSTVPFGALVRALMPFLVAQWMVLAAVLMAPQLVHLGERAGDASRSPTKVLSPDEMDRRLRRCCRRRQICQILLRGRRQIDSRRLVASRIVISEPLRRHQAKRLDQRADLHAGDHVGHARLHAERGLIERVEDGQPEREEPAKRRALRQAGEHAEAHLRGDEIERIRAGAPAFAAGGQAIAHHAPVGRPAAQPVARRERSGDSLGVARGARARPAAGANRHDEVEIDEAVVDRRHQRVGETMRHQAQMMGTAGRVDHDHVVVALQLPHRMDEARQKLGVVVIGTGPIRTDDRHVPGQPQREVLALRPVVTVLDVARQRLLLEIEIEGGDALSSLEQRHHDMHRNRRLAGAALVVADHDHMRTATRARARNRRRSGRAGAGHRRLGVDRPRHSSRFRASDLR
jgi:tripartite ATP-independent transporter DctM subunit